MDEIRTINYIFTLGTICNTNKMSYSTREYYESKSDHDLYKIFTGISTSSFNEKLWAEKILKEREFDFDNIEKYHKRWAEEKILNEIKSKSYLLDDNAPFWDKGLLITKYTTEREFNNLISILAIINITLLVLLIHNKIVGKDIIQFVPPFFIVAIVFFRNVHFRKQQNKIAEANKKRIREFMKNLNDSA